MKRHTTLRLMYWLKAAGAFRLRGLLLLFAFSSSQVIANGIDYMKDDSNLTVRGKVTSKSGEPITGVSVMVEGAITGTTTDADGSFELHNVPGNAVLVFSYVGYMPQRVEVADRVNINVVLSENNSEMGEVVVVGYGTQRKINLTGAVSQVKGEELEKRMNANVVSSLQGVVPNLNLSIGNEGGQPGASPSFNIRGPGSLSGGSPFVLVDGVPQDLNSINAADIESISVLKDASASAIYGVRAAYGVILITTRKGKLGVKPQISYSGNYALQKPTTLPRIVNSVEFATMVNDAFANAGQGVKYPPELIEKMKQQMANPGSLPTMVPNPLSPNEWDQNELYGNTNAYDLFFKKFGFNQDHNISMSGGSNSINYYISAGMFNQGSQWRYGDEYYKRYTITANISTEVTRWLKVGLNTRYIKRKFQMPHVYPLIGDYYHDIPRRWPIWPVVDGNGHYIIPTFVLMKEGGRNVNDQNQLLTSFVSEIKLANGWTVNADFNITQQNNSNNDHAKAVYLYKVDGTPQAHSYSQPTGFSINNSKNFFNSNNIYTTYKLNIGNHGLKVMAGVQSEFNRDESINVSRNETITDNVPFITTTTGAITIDGSKGHWATLGLFGRLNYNFDDRFMFEFSNRYDGTSRFASDRRWGFFPSVSAGYNVAREKFWNVLAEKISTFKLRGSYGTLGNQSISGSYYPYLASLGINTNLAWIMDNERPLYITAPGLVSSDLTWETTTTLNIGLDVEALNNRLSLSLDWYNRETDNMFGPLESYPAVLGVSPPRRNNAAMETVGFELAAAWRDRIGALQYQVKLMFADNTTTITKYRNASGTLSDYYEGKKLGEIWGYQTIGLFQSTEEIAKAADQSFIGTNWTPGDVHYADLNGDGKVNKGNSTLGNPGDQKVIGNNTPRYNYGLNLSLSWKGFDLEMLWQGVGKRDLWIGGNFLFGDAGNFNQSTIFYEHLDYWRPDNTNAFFPKPYMTNLKNKNIQVQSRYLQNGSYLRLKNLQLGYTFRQALISRVGLSALRVYFTGENIFTFTKLLSVFDPEATAGSIGPGKLYPLSTTYAMGIRLTLK